MIDRRQRCSGVATAGVPVVLSLVLACAALGAVPAHAAEPLASAPTNWPGVELDLMSVERKGNVLTVK
ncbi:MAG TPA: hypothetical protein VLF66_09020 [Thermoanaerobaculia bacterium]|nr:hypothetical protein [Thermoanaerobaculia bacterium]